MKPRGDVTRSPKQGYQCDPKNGHVSNRNLKKKYGHQRRPHRFHVTPLTQPLDPILHFSGISLLISQSQSEEIFIHLWPTCQWPISVASLPTCLFFTGLGGYGGMTCEAYKASLSFCVSVFASMEHLPVDSRGGSRGAHPGRRRHQNIMLPNFPKNCMKLRTFWDVGGIPGLCPRLASGFHYLVVPAR